MTSMSGQLLAHALCGWHMPGNRASLVESGCSDSGERSSLIENSLNTRLTKNKLVHPSFGLLSTGDIAQQTSTAEAETITASIIGHPRWDRPEWQRIADQQSPSYALLQAYLETGNECSNLIKGNFSCVVIDPREQSLFACVDRMGRFPLYYCNTSRGIAVASSPKALFATGLIQPRVKSQGIYNYVYFHMIPSPDTLFEDVQKLASGHHLISHRNALTCQRYWQVEFQEVSTATSAELGEEMKSVLRTAVSESYQPNLNNGTFLSGGLDSSTVTGVLSEQNPSPAYSMGFSAEGYDEIEFARATAKHFGVELHEYYVQPQDIVEALPRVAAAFDEPFGNSSALPTYLCARFAAEQGCQHLLAGDGGDELFAGNERYAKQRVFELYQQAPQAFREHLLEPTVNVLPAKLPLVSKARSYITQANTPLPDRLQSYNFLHRIAPQEVFTADFLETCTTESPLALLRSIYQTPLEASALNRMMYMDWQITLADNDLRKVGRMCELAGVEVSYPLLHDDLIAFSTRVPSEIKLRDNQLRDFFKKTLTGWLPDSTINKSKHGFGLPFGVWMREYKPLQEMAYDSLESLKHRDYFNTDFIDQALAQHREGHAAYYGELVWLLMTLELWHQQHASVISEER